jgi:hypothetical protein
LEEIRIQKETILVYGINMYITKKKRFVAEEDYLLTAHGFELRVALFAGALPSCY